MSAPTPPTPHQMFASYEEAEQFRNPVSLSYTHREMRMHSITDAELDSIASLGNSIDLAFFGICGGAFITLLVTVLTVPIQNQFEFAAFVGATIIAGVFSLFFGVRSLVGYKTAQRKIGEIKSSKPRSAS